MRYSIRHITRFDYEAPVAESVMEIRMQPRSDGMQRCLQFALTTSLPSRIRVYQDHDANIVHFFDIPGPHSRLTVTADAQVECLPPDPIPAQLKGDAWETLERAARSGEWWEYLAPSPFARSTPRLDEFSRSLELQGGGREDPLTLLRRLTRRMNEHFEYRPHATRVDSPIDEALQAGCGVCQDFAHIFIALVRPLGIPARYVSGYLFHGDSEDRSLEGATHAWVEACLPDLGWIGFDPTNNLMAGERHIRVALGRDYSDVPPTRGVYKGTGGVRSELSVAVQIGPGDGSPEDVIPFTPWMSREAGASSAQVEAEAREREQQQQ